VPGNADLTRQEPSKAILGYVQLRAKAGAGPALALAEGFEVSRIHDSTRYTLFSESM
jgi:hypothetical protein